MDPTATDVLDTTRRLFTAMRERDEAAMRALIHPQARFFSARPDGLRIRSRDEFIASCIDAADPVDERIVDAEIRVDGDVAALWAPYDLHLGPRFSHDGFDSFQFVREEGAWRLAGAAYTVRPR